MRAAFSLSLSRVVGQKASLPILLVHLLTGAPSLSIAVKALSKPDLLPDFMRSHRVWEDAMVASGAAVSFAKEKRQEKKTQDEATKTETRGRRNAQGRRGGSRAGPPATRMAITAGRAGVKPECRPMRPGGIQGGRMTGSRWFTLCSSTEWMVKR
ncbi:hypothetical protein MRB53_042059 [Persea americana]|nr:hypothetical protein MRB53_042059 [Persea americana]